MQVYLAAAGSGVEAEFEDDRRKELKVKVDGREWIFDFRIVKALKDASEHNVDADKHMEKIHPRDQDDRRDTRKVRLVFLNRSQTICNVARTLRTELLGSRSLAAPYEVVTSIFSDGLVVR